MDSGAIAIISDSGTICGIEDMPVVKVGNRNEINIPRIVAIIRAFNPRIIFVEKMQPLPAKMGGGIANFKRGGHLYLFRAICATLEIPLVEVPPKEWQKAYHFSPKDTKAQSYLVAARMFPDVSFFKETARSKKILDGRADACLIAEYGRRQQGGS